MLTACGARQVGGHRITCIGQDQWRIGAAEEPIAQPLASTEAFDEHISVFAMGVASLHEHPIALLPLRMVRDLGHGGLRAIAKVCSIFLACRCGLNLRICKPNIFLVLRRVDRVLEDIQGCLDVLVQDMRQNTLLPCLRTQSSQAIRMLVGLMWSWCPEALGGEASD